MPMLSRTKRISYYDTLKAVLIVLVVFGHTLGVFPFTSALRATYLLIYSFHMPLFIFVCGIFAKWKAKKSLSCLLVFLIFSTLQILFKVFVVSPSQGYTFLDIFKLFVYPRRGAWFLLAYAAYILSVWFIRKVTLWDILAAFTLSLVIGFVPFVNVCLSLSRIFYFFPFFLLGRWCGQNRNRFHNFIRNAQSGKLAPLFLSLAGLMLFATFLSLALYKGNIPISFFYGKYSYSKDFLDLVFGGRIICFSLALLNGISILLLIPMQPNNRSFSTNSFLAQGRNTLGAGTFSIYLFHILFLMVFKYYYVPSTIPIGADLAFAILLTILLLGATSIPPLRKGGNFLLNGFPKAH